MQKHLFALAVGLAAMLAPAVAANTTVQHSTVTMGARSPSSSRQGTNIRPFSFIYAQVSLVDSGSTLTIIGRGVGFNPALSYTSFFYGAGSVPNGSLACIPPTPNNLTVPQMITAYWLPVGSTRRTLTVVNSGTSYTPLSTIGTMSVRYDSTPTLPLSTNLNPGRFWLNSCGAIRTRDE